MFRFGASTLLAFSMLLGLGRTAYAEGDATRGKALFNVRCGFCHTVTDQNGAGPHLSGVFGRKAGTVEGFGYSKALPASGIVWNEQTLDNYLADPSKAVPDTSMQVRIPNAQDRADIIAYLKTVPAP